jgi:hypothetical protein
MENTVTIPVGGNSHEARFHRIAVNFVVFEVINTCLALILPCLKP